MFKNLYMARCEAGYSQEQLGQQVGCTQQQISLYENTETNISSNILIKLSVVLNKTPGYLLGLEDDDKPLYKIGDKIPTGKDIKHLYKYMQLSEKSKKIVDNLQDELFDS